MKKLKELTDTYWIILVIIIIDSMIIIPNIGRESLWFDEIFSATITQKSDSIIYMFKQYIFKDVHPPLYHILLYLWERLIGTSDFIIRFMNYIIFILYLLYSYCLIKKFFNTQMAYIFVLLSSFTPGVQYFMQEARSYLLLYCLSSIVTILYVIILHNIMKHKDIEKTLFTIFTIIGILTIYTHFFGYIIVFSLWISFLIFLIIENYNKYTIKRTLYTGIILGLFGFSWIIIMYYNSDITSKIHGNFWIKSDFYQVFHTANIFGDIYSVITLTIVIIIILFKYNNQLNKKYIFWILLPVFISIFIAVIISLDTPIITPKNLIIIIPAITLFFCYLFNIANKNNKILFYLFVMILLISSIRENFTYKKQNWRDASKYITEHYRKENCYIPIRNSIIDYSTGQNFMIYPSYYLKDNFEYRNTGPTIQKHCSLIYFDGHTTLKRIIHLLNERNITSYKILDYNRVFIVIKK